MITLLRIEHIRFRAYLTKRRTPEVIPKCDYS